MTDLSIASAFILGLLGSAHCFSMCGGIITALSSATDQQTIKISKSLNISKSLAYQIGRISSYTLIGLLAGLIGLELSQLSDKPILPIISAILLILMGFYMTRWWMALTYLEKAGSLLWKKINPLSKRLLPVNSLPKATLLGMLWGWLPCGLVYSALGYALATASPIKSALYMLFFGLGTLPATLSLGLASLKLKQLITSKAFQIVCGLILIGFGIYILQGIFFAEGSGHHHHH